MAGNQKIGDRDLDPRSSISIENRESEKKKVVLVDFGKI